MIVLMGQSYWALVAQALHAYLNYVQRRCLSTAGVVANPCGPMVNLMSGMSLGTRRHEDQGHIVGIDVKLLYRRVLCLIRFCYRFWTPNTSCLIKYSDVNKNLL
jgi:hypothetical protein